MRGSAVTHWQERHEKANTECLGEAIWKDPPLHSPKNLGGVTAHPLYPHHIANKENFFNEDIMGKKIPRRRD